MEHMMRHEDQRTAWQAAKAFVETLDGMLQEKGTGRSGAAARLRLKRLGKLSAGSPLAVVTVRSAKPMSREDPRYSSLTHPSYGPHYLFPACELAVGNYVGIMTRRGSEPSSLEEELLNLSDAYVVMFTPQGLAKSCEVNVSKRLLAKVARQLGKGGLGYALTVPTSYKIGPYHAAIGADVVSRFEGDSCVEGTLPGVKKEVAAYRLTSQALQRMQNALESAGLKGLRRG